MSKENPCLYYYDLFKFFSDAHGLTLLDSEIQDIIHAVKQHEAFWEAENSLVYEDQLPEMTAEEYAAWFKISKVVDGVRMGPNPDTIDWTSILK